MLMEATGVLVASLVFKTSVGLNKVPGGFDSHSPPYGASASGGDGVDSGGVEARQGAPC